MSFAGSKKILRRIQGWRVNGEKMTASKPDRNYGPTVISQSRVTTVTTKTPAPRYL